MSNKTFTLSDSLYQYLLSVSLRDDPLLRARLRKETAGRFGTRFIPQPAKRCRQALVNSMRSVAT